MNINDLAFRNDLVETIPGDIDLPPQFGEFGPPLPPGKYLLQIPANVAQTARLYDEKPKDSDGNPIESGQPVQRIEFDFGLDAPLVVIAGPHKDETLRARINSSPFKRGRKGSDAPLVANLTYLVREALKDKTPITTTRDWYNVMCSHAGHTIHVKTGYSAFCNDTKVRYVDDGQGGSTEDPSGQHGCGERYRTADFKQTDGSYATEINCDCGAVLRAFAQIEQYLPPIEG